MRIRNFSSGVLAAALAAGAAVGLPATVSAAPAATADDIVINEVLSKSDVDEDWVELANLNNEQDLDISGWKIADGGADNVPYEFPADTVIESGGYLSVYTDEGPDGFGLGSDDEVTLFDAAGDEVDSTTWQGHSPTTWGRIPDMTGDFAVTGEPTRTGRNTPAEPVDPVETSPWPFDPMTITPVALDGPFTGDDMSGVDIADDGTAYVVNNGAGTLHVLSYDQAAGTYTEARTFTLRYPDGTGIPDSEGVTVDPSGAVFVATERDDDNDDVSRPSVLRFELPADADSGELSATDEYDFSGLTGPIGANSGLETIEYIADAWGGAFAVGVEGTGIVHFVQFGAEGAVNELRSFDSPFPGVMALDYDAATGVLRVLCDEVCEGRSLEMTFDGEKFDTDGTLYARPAGMPNHANEGFALRRENVECTTGSASGTADRIRVLWTDDAAADGVGLRTAVTAAGGCEGDDDNGSVAGFGELFGSLGGSLGPIEVALTSTAHSNMGTLPEL